MADRKRQVKQAIAESVEMSQPMKKPAPSVSNAPIGPKEDLDATREIKRFKVNPDKQIQAKSKPHRRAVVDQAKRQEEFATANAAAKAEDDAIQERPARKSRYTDEQRAAAANKVSTDPSVMSEADAIRSGKLRPKRTRTKSGITAHGDWSNWKPKKKDPRK